MDRYEKMLEFDVRFTARQHRYDPQMKAKLQAYQDTLPDLASEVRFSHPEGGSCGQERTQELLRWHSMSVADLLKMKAK